MSTKPPWRYFSPAQARGGNMTTALEHPHAVEENQGEASIYQ
jgi:hypothetical protein